MNFDFMNFMKFKNLKLCDWFFSIGIPVVIWRKPQGSRWPYFEEAITYEVKVKYIRVDEMHAIY